MLKFWRRRERKREDVIVVPNPEVKEARERADKAVTQMDNDLSAIRVHSRRSRLERHRNHFAPAILAALESSRREE